MIADNFELEPPEHCRPVEEEEIASSSLNYDFILNDEGNNSKGLSQPLLLSEEDEDEHAAATDNDNSGDVGKDDAKLLLSFFLMLIVGTLNKIFQKLQAIVSTTSTHHAQDPWRACTTLYCQYEQADKSFFNTHGFNNINVSQCTIIPTVSISSKTSSMSPSASSTSFLYQHSVYSKMPSLLRYHP